MKMIYHTQFIYIGAFAREALDEKMLITFKQGVPSDLADYCFVHSHGDLTENMRIGDEVSFDQQNYTITALGDIANENFRTLGHVTWRFDGALEAEYPGTIHLHGDPPVGIDINSSLIIKRKNHVV